MRKILIFALVLATLLMSGCGAVDNGDGNWNKAFSMCGIRNGWLCGDGIYSVSLDGRDSIGSATDETVSFFIFSDSFIGSAKSDGTMRSESMVNHSGMILSGNIPSKDAFDFVYGYKGDTSSTGNIFGEERWFFDMLSDGENLYLFGFEEESWKPMQIDMYTVPIVDGNPDFANFTKTADIEELLFKCDEADYAFGTAITPNTETAGAANPDGYYYFYGFRDNLSYLYQTKDLLIARIHEDDFPDFSKLRYFDSEDWCEDIEESAAILENVSCEMSVTPITEGPHAGKYIAIYTEFVQSSHIMYALGDSPVGPFDTPIEFYTAPEAEDKAVGGNGTLYTYNAKAHPHLSDGNKLLITYNINVRGAAAENCRDYTPRFLYLDLDMQEPAAVTIEMPEFDKSETRIVHTALTAAVTCAIGVTAVIIIKIRKKHKNHSCSF